MTGAEGESGTSPVRGLPPIHESLLPRDHALHRPRHGNRQRTALTCALVFFLVPALAFVFGVRPQAFENRRLAAFPSPGAGWGFFTGLPNWATDHLPLRQAGVQAETGVSEGLFGEPPAFSRTDRQSSGAPIGPIALPPSPDQPQPGGGSHVDFSQVVEGTSGWLYFAQDMSSKCQPNRPLATTVAALRQLRSEVESSGRRLVLVVAPDKSTVLPQHLPADYPDRQCSLAAAAPFWSAVTGAGALDLRAGLRALSAPGTTPIYYPQDTHWTDLGSLDLLRSVADRIEPGVSIPWRTAPNGLVVRPADLPPLVGQSGTDLGVRYALRPDGTHDLTGPAEENLTHPVHFGSGRPVPGMITEPVTLLGDSFLERSTRYLPAVFGNATAVAYSSLVSHPDEVQAALVPSRIVVVEVVERDLANGSAQFLLPGPLAAINTALASHPVH